MGYALNESMVRVDRFKPNGKWYDSFEVDMGAYYNAPDIREAVLLAWRLSRKDGGMRDLDTDWMLVCLEPYHRHSHPIMVKG